jgi:hypothetical protein
VAELKAQQQVIPRLPVLSEPAQDERLAQQWMTVKQYLTGYHHVKMDFHNNFPGVFGGKCMRHCREKGVALLDNHFPYRYPLSILDDARDERHYMRATYEVEDK